MWHRCAQSTLADQGDQPSCVAHSIRMRHVDLFGGVGGRVAAHHGLVSCNGRFLDHSDSLGRDLAHDDAREVVLGDPALLGASDAELLEVVIDLDEASLLGGELLVVDVGQLGEDVASSADSPLGVGLAHPVAQDRRGHDVGEGVGLAAVSEGGAAISDGLLVVLDRAGLGVPRPLAVLVLVHAGVALLVDDELHLVVVGGLLHAGLLEGRNGAALLEGVGDLGELLVAAEAAVGVGGRDDRVGDAGAELDDIAVADARGGAHDDPVGDFGPLLDGAFAGVLDALSVRIKLDDEGVVHWRGYGEEVRAYCWRRRSGWRGRRARWRW